VQFQRHNVVTTNFKKVFSVCCIFTELQGNTFQQRAFLCSRVHVLAGWRLSPNKTRRCFATADNNGGSSVSCASARRLSQPRAVLDCLPPSSESVSEYYITTDGQSASLFWNIGPVWDLRSDFYYCQTDAGLLMWGTLSDERMGLSFTIAASTRQRSSFRVRVLWDS
jgi:hypothetical protein